MKLFFAVLAVLFCAASAHAADVSEFQKGVEKYEAGLYRDAAGIYEKLVSSGQRTAAVYYNLGNAYFRSGEKGKALLAYNRALAITPRDENVRWNITVVKSALTDRIDEDSESILRMWMKRLLDRVSIDETAKLFSCALAGLALLSFLVWILPGLRGFLAPLRVLLIIIFILCTVLFALKWNDAKDPRVIILTKEVYARFGPNLKETKAFLLHEGAEARVVDETNGWVYVTLPNKNSGWLPKETCEKI